MDNKTKQKETALFASLSAFLLDYHPLSITTSLTSSELEGRSQITQQCDHYLYSLFTLKKETWCEFASF